MPQKVRVKTPEAINLTAYGLISQSNHPGNRQAKQHMERKFPNQNYQEQITLMAHFFLMGKLNQEKTHRDTLNQTPTSNGCNYQTIDNINDSKQSHKQTHLLGWQLGGWLP